MTKFALVLHRKSGVSRERYEQTLEDPPGPDGRAGDEPSHLTLHRIHASDALRAEALRQTPQQARCDGLAFAWYETAPAPNRSAPDPLALCDRYPVDEVIHWDELDERKDGPWTPGIKMIAVVRRREELSRQEFRERYLEHANIAQRHHPGVARYVQNFVVGSPEESAPPVDAIAELHFPSIDDLTRRFYRDETSPQIVGADVVRFLARGASWSVLAEERVVR